MTLDALERSQAVQPGYFCECAQCGDAIMAPEWSEHVSERCVRHFWSCDACGYEFETSVYLHEGLAVTVEIEGKRASANGWRWSPISSSTASGHVCRRFIAR